MGNCGMIAGAFSSAKGKADTVMDTSGQILYYTSSRQALNIGSEGTVLTVSGSDLPAWEAAGGLSSPLTSDLVYNDSVKAAFGTGGSDSYINHDGSNMQIQTSTGKLVLDANAQFSSGKCLANSRASATISSGTITGTCNTMLVDTEGGASSDSLDSADFTGAAVTGAFFQLGTSNDSRDVTVEDQSVSPYFLMAGDFTLDNQHDTIFFNAQNGLTHNNEISRSSNA